MLVKAFWTGRNAVYEAHPVDVSMVGNHCVLTVRLINCQMDSRGVTLAPFSVCDREPGPRRIVHPDFVKAADGEIESTPACWWISRWSLSRGVRRQLGNRMNIVFLQSSNPARPGAAVVLREVSLSASRVVRLRRKRLGNV